MAFHELDEDILPQILAFCDVQSVLRMGQANKLLRALTLSAKVWRAVVMDLSYRGITDVLPEDMLRAGTTTDLLAEVKRTVLGPKTWSLAHSPIPTIARQLSLPSPVVADSLRAVRLLPGGEYIAFQRDFFLEFWSVPRRECVWTWHSPAEFLWCVDVRDGGRTAFVLLFTHRRVLLSNSTWTDGRSISIVQVELKTKEESVLFESEPFEFVSHPPVPTMSGDFFAMAYDNRYLAEMVLVVNWRAQQYVAFELQAGKSMPITVTLLPNHVVVTYALADPPHNLLLTVYNIDSLSSSWRPLTSFSRQNCTTTDVRAVVSDFFQIDGILIREPEYVNVSLHKSALCSGTYTVKLVVYDYVALPLLSGGLAKRLFTSKRAAQEKNTMKKRSNVFTFSVSALPTVSPVWRMISTIPGATTRFEGSPTISGYAVPSGRSMMLLDVNKSRDGVEQSGPAIILGAGDDSWIASVAPSSTALVVIKDQTILILYYR